MQTEGSSQKIAVIGATGRVGSLARGDPRAARARRGGDRAFQGRGRGQRGRPRRRAPGGRDRHRRRHRAFTRPGVGNRVLHHVGTEPPASGRGSRGGADRRRLDHRDRQVPRRLQRGEGGAGAGAAGGAAPGADRASGPVPRVRRSAGGGGRSRTASPTCPRCGPSSWPPASWPRRSPTPPRSRRFQNGRITEVAGPREERLADAAAALLATPGRLGRGPRGPWRTSANPDDPDAAAYAEGAALPNPGRQARRSPVRGVARGGLGQHEPVA